MKKWIIYLVIFIAGPVSAQDTLFTEFSFGEEISPVRYDTSDVDVREISQAEADAIRNDSRYHYLRSGDKSLNIWETIRTWLQNQIREILRLFKIPEANAADVISAVEVVIYIIIFAAIAVLIYLIYRARFRGFLTRKGRRSRGDGDYELFDDDIHAISYESEIEKAVREQNYRKALRLRFLQTLKLLSDGELIEWKPNRTNREYLNTLKDQDLSADFRKLILWYEYAWYGEFDVTQAQYEKFAALEKSFENFVRSKYTIEQRVEE